MVKATAEFARSNYRTRSVRVGPPASPRVWRQVGRLYHRIDHTAVKPIILLLWRNRSQTFERRLATVVAAQLSFVGVCSSAITLNTTIVAVRSFERNVFPRITLFALE